jgi:hypothetical protein
MNEKSPTRGFLHSSVSKKETLEVVSKVSQIKAELQWNILILQ